MDPSSLIPFAKVMILITQAYMNGVCFTTCRDELMGIKGYWIDEYKSCACISYVKPEDSVLAIKLEPGYRSLGASPAQDNREDDRSYFKKKYDYPEPEDDY